MKGADGQYTGIVTERDYLTKAQRTLHAARCTLASSSSKLERLDGSRLTSGFGVLQVALKGLASRDTPTSVIMTRDVEV